MDDVHTHRLDLSGGCFARSFDITMEPNMEMVADAGRGAQQVAPGEFGQQQLGEEAP